MLRLFRFCPKLFKQQRLLLSSLIKQEEILQYGTIAKSSYWTENNGYSAKGRNSRKPKKANHGKRPCSSFMRRIKNVKNYKKSWNIPDPEAEYRKTDIRSKSEEGYDSDREQGSDYYLIDKEHFKRLKKQEKVQSD